jgi:hypothetical protein
VPSKSNGYKVWSGRKSIHGNIVKIILAAKSQKEAANALGITVTELKENWDVTYDITEVATALSVPNRQMFQFLDHKGHPYGHWLDLLTFGMLLE